MAGNDPARLAFVRTLPCCAPGAPTGCLGTVAPHHHTQYRGMGQRAVDDQTMPLCWGHHRAFHDGRGPFRDWGQGHRRAWQDEQVAACQVAWDRHLAGIEGEPPIPF